MALLREIDRLQDELWALAYEPATDEEPGNQPGDVKGQESDVVQFVRNVADTTGLGGDGAIGETPTLDEAVPSRKDRHYWSGKRKGRYHLVTRTWRTRKDPFEDGQVRTLQRRVREWRLKQSTFVANEVNQCIRHDDNTEGNTPFGKTSRSGNTASFM